MSLKGTIKWYTALKGFGFIIASDGSEPFFHAYGIADGTVPQQGDVVTYDLESSTVKPGQMQACNVSGGTGKPLTKGGGKGGAKGSTQGQVKSFNPEKRFGFITGPDGTDVFLHASNCVDGGTPQQGDWVYFDMEPSTQKEGQMLAVNVSGGTGWGKGGKGDSWGKGGKGGKGGDWGGEWGGDGWGGMQNMMAMMGAMLSHMKAAKGGGKDGGFGVGKDGGFGGGKDGGIGGGKDGGCGGKGGYGAGKNDYGGGKDGGYGGGDERGYGGYGAVKGCYGGGGQGDQGWGPY